MASLGKNVISIEDDGDNGKKALCYLESGSKGTSANGHFQYGH